MEKEFLLSIWWSLLCTVQCTCHLWLYCACYVCNVYLTILVRKNFFWWALTILIFVHNLNPVSPKIDLSKRCAAEPTILVILVKRNHWPSPHFLDSGTPRDNCSNWRHRFSCGQLHVCGSNYTSVWTQSPNTLSSISVPTLFFCHSYLLHVHVFVCACDIKKEPENCVGDIWSVARVDNAVLPSFLLSHSPPGNNNGKTVSFVHLSINSRQMKYFVLSYWIRN